MDSLDCSLVKGEEIFKGRVNPESCVGCLMCLFSCSFRAYLEYNPALAYIRVGCPKPSEAFDITFTEECDSCFVCVERCSYQALELP